MIDRDMIIRSITGDGGLKRVIISLIVIRPILVVNAELDVSGCAQSCERACTCRKTDLRIGIGTCRRRSQGDDFRQQFFFSHYRIVKLHGLFRISIPCIPITYLEFMQRNRSPGLVLELQAGPD
ncbi:hypothetical protein D3C73_1052510 [compost metagenome]